MCNYGVCNNRNHNHSCNDSNKHGHHVSCCGVGHNHKHSDSGKMILRIIITLVLLVFYVIFKPESYVEPGFANIVKFFEFLLCYLIVAGDIAANAFKNLVNRQLVDENFLMTIAAFGAFCIGEYPEGIMVMVLYQTGELFHSYAVKQSRKSIADLMKIKPEYANVLRDGKILKVHPDEVKPGEIIIIKPGEKVPLDGIVTEGFGSIDSSNLTGESIPKEISLNDEILSGYINLNSVLRVKVLKEFRDSAVSKILNMVENAAGNKAKTEKFITKFARIYTPFVVFSAILLAILPPVLFGSSFLIWFERALTFLVISCPCALVISIPLGFFAGIGAASRSGILIKGSNYLEAFSNAKTFVFDKTGTLTEGCFKVSGIISASEFFDKSEILKLAAYAENYSTHPVAKSIKDAYGKDIDTSKIKDLKEFPGKGISANVFDKNIIAGNESIMKMFNILVTNPENSSGTIVHIASNGEYLGCIVISDSIKQNAKDVISKLKQTGAGTIMLTGDTKAAALGVQKELGLDEVYFNLLPNEKVDKVEKMLSEQKQGEILVFTGDGINDAPVLTRADIGISMGKLGSDAAIEASDIVITDDNLLKIYTALKISKKTIRIVKQNIVLALGIKALFLIFGAFGFVTMWGAVFADVGVSFIAILNSLRMLYAKRV